MEGRHGCRSTDGFMVGVSVNSSMGGNTRKVMESESPFSKSPGKKKLQHSVVQKFN